MFLFSLNENGFDTFEHKRCEFTPGTNNAFTLIATMSAQVCVQITEVQFVCLSFIIFKRLLLVIAVC